MKIKIYKTDGSIEIKKVKGNKLKMLQDAVGGYIELLPGYKDIYCNEEGFLLNLAPNPYFLNVFGNVVEKIKG